MTTNNLKQYLELIKQYDEIGTQLNTIKEELRQKELNLKTKRLKLEFSEEYEQLRDGLKVKEIPYMINEQTTSENEEICKLKSKRDKLELEFQCVQLHIDYIKEVINSNK